MPFVERIREVTPAVRIETAAWLIDAREHMEPATEAQIAAVIHGLFEANDHPLPTKYALGHWFEAFAPYPLWALQEAAHELVLESPHKPTIADLHKRVLAAVGPHETLISMARMLLDYGQEPEEIEPQSEERRAAVRALMAGAEAGIKNREIDPDDNRQ